MKAQFKMVLMAAVLCLSQGALAMHKETAKPAAPCPFMKRGTILDKSEPLLMPHVATKNTASKEFRRVASDRNRVK